MYEKVMLALMSRCRLVRVRPITGVMLSSSIIVGIAEIVVGYRIIGKAGLPDPDNYMRIVRIRDGLRTDGFTHVVAADNGGAGTVVYWSHLIDALVLALRKPFSLVWDDQTALFYAAAATGPLVAAAFVAVLVWSVAPLARVRFLYAAPFVAALSPLIFYNGIFGYVHHHLPLALMTVLSAAFAGRATTGRLTPAVWCGISSAVGVWISPEAIPYVLMTMGAIGVAWCLRPEPMARPLAACGAAFAAATVAALLIDPPYGGRLSPEVDCISIIYAVLSLLLWTAMWLLIIVGQYARSVAARSFYCTCACAAVFGVWLSLYPNLTHGLAGVAPGSDTSAFFNSILEMQPLHLDTYLPLVLMTGLLGVLAALGLAFQTRNLLWGYAAGCGIVVLGLAVTHIRFAIYVEAIGALMLPVVLERVSSSRLRPIQQSVLRSTVLAVFLMGPFLPALAAPGSQSQQSPMADCQVRDIVPVLRDQKDAVLLTEISDTPEILWRTPVRTVGSLYHRSINAFLRARAAWRSAPSDTAPRAVLETGATHILACDLTGRTALVGDLSPTTLQDRLSHHDVPPWLHEIGRGGGYRVYVIDLQSTTPPSRTAHATAMQHSD
jgi:hypothetical protein